MKQKQILVHEIEDRGMVTKFLATRWQKNGHDRIYVDVQIRAMKNQRSLGYIDLSKPNKPFVDDCCDKQYLSYAAIARDIKDTIIEKVLEEVTK